jgi:hypothetical protein
LGAVAALLVLLALSANCGAQSGSQGTIVVTVLDASGGLVPGANLELIQVDTNDRRSAAAGSKGVFTFVDLPIGLYQLNVFKDGYATTSLDRVAVHAAQTTDVTATLKVGQRSETINVDASSSSLIETSSSAIGMVIDLKYVEDLPLGGRDLSSLVALTPGFAGTPGYSESGLQTGNFNGQVEMDTSSSVDGVIGQSSRGKYYGGNAAPAVTARVENIQEMSVQTDMMDVDQGMGQASMQVNYVSRSGTNNFHGRLFEDFKNDGLYANTWQNDASGQSKQKVIYNDFGGSAGGPILHDKLFFFASFSTRRIPGTYDLSNPIMPTSAQAGNFGYVTSSGTTQVNLFNIEKAQGLGLPTAQNAVIASQLALINTAVSSGTVTATPNDPNVSVLNWKQSNPQILYYPLGRLDYNISPKLRAGLSWSMTQNSQPDANTAPFPGSGFSNQINGNQTRNFTLGALLNWTVSPNLINDFRGGFLYDDTSYSYNAKPLYATQLSTNWGVGTWASGQSYSTPVTEYYPLFNGSDTVSWQHHNHTAKFGGSWYREQDHYWNPPAGYPTYFLNLAPGDPALNAFSTANFPNATGSQINEAENLYATLTGRIGNYPYGGGSGGVTGSNTYSAKAGGYSSPGTISAYNLDEVSMAWAWYAQDSWRILPSLTLNYGLRWDYTGDNYDKTGAYHSAGPSGVYGPTKVGDLFNPGSLGGAANPVIAVNPHAYAPWHRSPQPQVGLAWNPKVDDGALGKLLGGASTVVRAGFSLKKFTEPYQFYWDAASDYGSFFYQYFNLFPGNSTSTGYFAPGSLSLGGKMPAYALSPTQYYASEPEASLTFQGFPMVGMDPKIPQPYVETWNLGIQRQLGSSRAIEIRYQGNHSVHQWVGINPNEVNIFENGFLTEFQHAQQNLKIYTAANPACGQGSNAPCSFANNGLSGQVALPIMTQAFQGEPSGGPGSPLADFGNAQFTNYLTFGAAGSMASVLSGYQGTVPYICNLIGANFSPCQNVLGYTGTGTYPINFFQANPYASGNGSTEYLAAVGYANFESFQAEFRQQNWKGLQWNANYAWAHTLGLASQENWTAGANMFTLRNALRRRNYTPGEYDIRHVIHMNGTYDLPFGKGKQWLGANNLLSQIAGNWTVGNIVTWQTGMPQQLSGGYQTFNDYADGGVVLGNGLTARQLQKAVHVHRLPQSVIAANGANGIANYVVMLDSKYLASPTTGGVNPTYLTPNTTAGVLGQAIFLHGPHGFYHDISLSKTFPVREKLKMQLQGEFLNVWNHPVFGNANEWNNGEGFMNPSTQSSAFGLNTSGPNNLPRHIQIRANIEF